MNREEIEKHVEVISRTPEVTEIPAYMRGDAICALARGAIGLDPNIDIAFMQQKERDAILSIISGVRDALVASADPDLSQASNLTINVVQDPKPYFAR